MLVLTFKVLVIVGELQVLLMLSKMCQDQGGLKEECGLYFTTVLLYGCGCHFDGHTWRVSYRISGLFRCKLSSPCNLLLDNINVRMM